MVEGIAGADLLHTRAEVENGRMGTAHDLTIRFYVMLS